MPEIEITEDQHEYLQALREDIQRDLVGKYAQVRTVDALEYLIDNHEGEVDGTVSSPVDGPDADVEAPVEVAEDSDDGEEVEDGEADADGADEGAGDGNDEAGDGESDAGDEDEASDDADADGEDDGDDAEGGNNGAPKAAAGGGGDDGMLSAMMALMDTHDDKWEKASGDTGYEVELPDGSTESANTQDDVRALLFKHYE